MALVRMVPDVSTVSSNLRIPEPYEDNAEWVRDHRGQWWWRPWNPRNRTFPQQVWYTLEGKLIAEPKVDLPQGKGKERLNQSVEESQCLEGLWYSADCQTSGRLVTDQPEGKGKGKGQQEWENGKGKGKGKERVEEGEEEEEYWEEDPEGWGYWGEDPDPLQEMEEWAHDQGFRANAQSSGSSGNGQPRVPSGEYRNQNQRDCEVNRQEVPFVWGMDPELRQRGRTEVVVIPPSSRSLTADGRSKATVARSERRKRSKSRQRMEAEAGLVGQRETPGLESTVHPSAPRFVGHQEEVINHPRPTPAAPVGQGLLGREALIPVRDIGTALDPVVARVRRRRRDYTLGASECQDVLGRLRSVIAGVGVLRSTADGQLASRTLQGMGRDLEVMEQTVMVLEGRIGRLHQTAVQDDVELARARTGVVTLTNLLGGGFPSLAVETRQ